MREIPIDLIQHTINELVRAPNVRAVFVYHSNGDLAAKSGSEAEAEQDLLQQMPSGLLSATKRMAERSGNANEAQSVVLPDDDLYLLLFWLAFEYFLVVSLSKPANPYSPPHSVLKTCDLIRLILQPERPGKQALSSGGLDLQTEIYIERLLDSEEVIKDTWQRPNLYDLSYLEAQHKQVVEIAEDILANKIGLIEGARLLLRLRPTVTQDDFDPGFIPLMAFVSETDDLPVGKDRQLWASDALLEKDKEIQKAEELYRDDVFAACQVIIERFRASS